MNAVRNNPFGLLATASALTLAGCAVAKIESSPPREQATGVTSVESHDRQLARLLVRLERKTRGVIAGHYVAADAAHRDWMAESLLLPAAVADKVFHEVVPKATGDRAWVKMVVDEPRNLHNVGDETATSLLAELRRGTASAERSTAQAYYYAEPIEAAKACLLCHGSPKGEPDPYFPHYKKNGWEEGQVIGAIVARVATGV